MEAEFFAVLTDSDKLVPIHKEITDIFSFLRNIDWSEPWLIGLLIFHIITVVLTIATRHHGSFQGVFFFLLLILVLLAKQLNELGANHWEYFARHQYFDSNGMFISIVFSCPILLNCLVMVGHWLWLSGSMTIKIKQAQLRARLRAESRAKKQLRESQRTNQDAVEKEKNENPYVDDKKKD